MAQILEDLSIRNCIPEFIYKLYAILMMDKHSDVIAWENNTEVCIKDQKKMQGVLGEYFRHTRLDSFIRQLNMYGFNKVIKLGRRKELYFSNPHFRKGHIDDMVQIKRKKKFRDEENEDSEGERYKHFIHGNVSVMYENITELRNNNPIIAQDLNRILEILSFMVGKGTAATISEEVKEQVRDFMMDRQSVCSIERQFKN